MDAHGDKSDNGHGKMVKTNSTSDIHDKSSKSGQHHASQSNAK
jgi:hypothetical protein